MKNFKKMLALVIAAVMIVGTMSMAFAVETIVPEGLTADPAVTINGLDAGDTVTLYKVIQWANNADNTSAGWTLVAPFASDEACKAVLAKINGKKDEGPYSLTKDDVKAFTDVINAGGSFTTPSGTNNDGTYTATVDPGMYLALIKPYKTDTLYNPIIVSADYFRNNPETSEIDASSAFVGGNTSFAKKETLKVEKEEEDDDDTTECSYDVGDNVGFTVKTTIPTFAEAYTNPSFKVTDEMSKGLVLDTTKGIKVYDKDPEEGGREVVLTDADSNVLTLSTAVVPNSTKGWTLDIPSAYLKALAAPTPLYIVYEATLTETAFSSVTEEVNDVKVEFSNNPGNSQDHGTVEDKTRTYTFSIDGSLLGSQNESTSELVKVAVDGNGDPIYQSSSTNTTHTNALAGAEFALFKSDTSAEAYTGTKTDLEALTSTEKDTAGIYYNANFTGAVITDSNGFMEINGLDEGTYYLKELKAPAGFIKDQKVHEIRISATYGTETVTVDNGYTYDLPVLESYTITVDGTENSYSMTLEGSDITTSAIIKESNSLLNNTKGIELPSTGGMGTTLFYAIGAILVLGAGILLVSKRRMAAN